MAVQQREPAPGLLLHSDRGSQYAGLEYQALLDQHGIRYSMSRKGELLGQCRDGTLLSEFEDGACMAT
jgi:putative transposase